MRRNLFVCAAALLCWAAAARAQWVDPSLSWRTLDSAHFSVHFAEPYRAQARLVAEVAESVYPRVTGWLRWRPESRTHILVLDSADFSNGYATPLPFNYFAIFLSPPDSGELLQNRDWLELVVTHEFTHIVHLDKARGAPLVMRRIFGRWLFVFPVALPSAFPNLLQPDWLIEGLAVYSESDPKQGWGRLGQSEFEGQMRAETARGLRSLYEVNAEGRGFPLNRDYLYGGYFYGFLAERYGPKAVADYVENYSNRWIPFRVDTNPRAITGKNMDALWLDYQNWLRARFAERPGGQADQSGEILERAWSITSPALAPGGERWYVRADGYTLPVLVRRSPDGKAVAVREVEADTRVAPSADGVLLSQFEICGSYNYYYDLYRVSADGGRERVTRCGRYRFAAPLGGGRIAAVRVIDGEGEVVLLNANGAVERSLYRAPRGVAITRLPARGETGALTSLRNGVWSLIEVGGGEAKVLLADAAVKHSPRFGDSADEIYFVANYGNVYDVWSLGRGGKTLARWTRAATGVSEISSPVAGELLLTTIEPDGGALRLLRLPPAPLERREAVVAAGAPAPAPEEEQRPLPDRPYSPWSSLLPRAWLPAAQIADGAVALGASTYGQDALGLHQYAITPMYEFTQHEWLGSLAYAYNDRHQLLLDRTLIVRANEDKPGGSNGFTDKDITAYTTTDRAQWVSTFQYLTLAARSYAGLGGALDRERFHQVGDGTVSDRDERVLGLVGGVDTRRQQWLSEGPTQGQQLRLWAETSNGLGGAFSGNVYRADWRGYVALGPTVLSMRWNQVYAQPDAEAIKLGGSFSEETFALPVMNQRDFPLRGYRSGEPELTGHHATLQTVEWRVPLSDVDRHVMSPPAGLNRLSMDVFMDGGSAWDDGASQRYFKGAGLEVLSEVRVGYQLGAQLRGGVARGLETPGRTVWYLQVGRSF